MIVAAWCLFAALAAAAPELLLGLEPGQSKEEVEHALARADVEATRSRSVDRQALAQNLVRTHFLETMNRFQAAPLDKQGELDARAFQLFLRAEHQGREYVLAFSEKALSYVFVRIPVPIDAPNSSAERFHRLREALQMIAGEGYTLAAKDKDHWGNVFFWTGHGREGAKVEAWYVPELDELRILLHATR